MLMLFMLSNIVSREQIKMLLVVQTNVGIALIAAIMTAAIEEIAAIMTAAMGIALVMVIAVTVVLKLVIQTYVVNPTV